MNNRVLELLFQPHQINQQDLPLIQNEIKKYPFVQSFRALYLLGVSTFEQENYNAILANTAAFTTDKKILYHLVNGKRNTPITPEESENHLTKESIGEESHENKDAYLEEEAGESEININQETIGEELIQVETWIKPEEESNVIAETTENKTITSKSVIEKSEENTQTNAENETIESHEHHLKAPPEMEEHISETTQNDTEVEENKAIVKGKDEEEVYHHEINFHENTESHFVHAPVKREEHFVPTKNETLDKYEEERRKLIEEVERKLKEKKQSQSQEVSQEEENLDNFNLNFSEAEMAWEKEQKETEVTDKEEASQENTSSWQPMNLHAEKHNFRKITTEKKQEENDTSNEETAENTLEEAPIMTVSFFTPTVTPIAVEEENFAPQEEKNEEEKKQEVSPKAIEDRDSNIPTFLSTWQSWLKIDRSSSVKTFTSPKKAKVENVKAQAIDKFIETEPKISPIKKDETTALLIKERKDDDILHLMTETLANIYVEQRLYSRALEAYEVLMDKHPSKKEIFEQKIEEIKKLKNANLGQ